jgi:hypothetical protein
VIEFDASQVDRLAVEIGKAEAKAAAGMYAIGTHAAVNVKKGMAEQVKRHPHFRPMADAITYDVRPAGLASVLWTIGPDKQRRAGALGNLFYFGSSKNAPVEDIGVALREETSNIERALLELGDF